MHHSLCSPRALLSRFSWHYVNVRRRVMFVTTPPERGIPLRVVSSYYCYVTIFSISGASPFVERTLSLNTRLLLLLLNNCPLSKPPPGTRWQWCSQVYAHARFGSRHIIVNAIPSHISFKTCWCVFRAKHTDLRAYYFYKPLIYN